LSCKNPNKKDEIILRSPEEILGEIQMLDEETNDILNQIRELI
jgi:type I restriction enzyme M protein